MSPPLAYGWGRLQSAAILEGRDYQYVVSMGTGNPTIGDAAEAKNRVKYLGQVNDYVFLLLPDNATLDIMRFEDTRGLQLRRFSK